MMSLPLASTLPNVQAQGARLVEVETEIAELNRRVEQLKAESNHLRTVEIPRMMSELDIQFIGIGNRVLKMVTKVRASLPTDPARREETINWLHSHGHGGIIKRSIVAMIDDNLELQHRVLETLGQEGLNAQANYAIHHSTYTALAKTLVRSGEPAPLERMGIHSFREAEVE
jgi:hypothetical protein